MSWTAAILAVAIAIDCVRARARGRTLQFAAITGLGLAACAHACVCLADFDLGFSLGACSIAIATSAASLHARKHAKATRWAVSLAATCAVACAAELALPPRCAWPGTQTHDSIETWSADPFRPDPELGWVMQSNAAVEDVAYDDPDHVEWRALYHTDRDGGRAVPARPESGPAVLLFGCSYAFGHGLHDHETIAARLQSRLTDRRVFDYGALAYGTVQSGLALRRCEQAQARSVVYLFIDDHLRRDAGERGWLRQFPDEPLFDVSPAGELVRRPGRRVDALAHRIGWSLWKRSALFRRLDGIVAHRTDDETDVRRAAAAIEAMRRDVRTKWGSDCRFTTIFVPEAHENAMTARARRLFETLQQRGIDCIDGFAESGWRRATSAPGGPDASFDRATGHPRAALADEIADWIARAIGAGDRRLH